ncbi:MAG: NIPSNAP family containing protein [Verrucomicrobia bacterium]|nr:NIPSNAP family containing protein [Verrucomicrobiota bacterium]
MNRRAFLTSSIATVSAATCLAPQASTGAAESAGAPAREFYELRRYHLRRGPKTRLVDEYIRQAAIPAWNRLGIGPIGAFNVATGPDSPSLYLLIPSASLEQAATADTRLWTDPEYQRAGAEMLNAPATDPAFVRVENSLLRAFAGMPKLEVPAAAKEGRSRLFELRIYESHSKKANLKKIEMFNEGEIAVFRKTGLAPVFFGETVVGSKLPNLTYMLVFENLAARDKNWGAFVADPDWRKLSTTPGYTDPEIVTNISSLFLRPTSYSQI